MVVLAVDASNRRRARRPSSSSSFSRLPNRYSIQSIIREETSLKTSSHAILFHFSFPVALLVETIRHLESSRLAMSEASLPSRASLIFDLQSPLLLPPLYILYPSEWILGGKGDRRYVFGSPVPHRKPCIKSPLSHTYFGEGGY